MATVGAIGSLKKTLPAKAAPCERWFATDPSFRAARCSLSATGSRVRVGPEKAPAAKQAGRPALQRFAASAACDQINITAHAAAVTTRTTTCGPSVLCVDP